MSISINTKQKTPAYLQLYQALRKDIVSGAYPLHGRLPSKRTIAAETGLSVIPVEHALRLLCEEGYIETRQRSGSYVIYRASDFQGNPAGRNGSSDGNGRTDVIDAADGAWAEPPFRRKAASLPDGAFPYSVLARTMRRIITDYEDRLLVKSPNPGLSELRSAICAYLERSRGVNVRPDQIIVGSGAEYLYGLIAQFLGRDRIYALEDPSYDKIRKVYKAYGAVCEFLPLGAGGIRSEALAASGADVLHVTPFNSFPSGVSCDASKKQEYLRWAVQRNGFVIEDNYESELTVSRKAEETIFSMSDEGRVLYVNTFSKTITPSLRTGYLILPERLTESFRDRLGFYSCTVPVFDQYLLTELLNSGEYERHINRVRRQRRRQSGKT